MNIAPVVTSFARSTAPPKKSKGGQTVAESDGGRTATEPKGGQTVAESNGGRTVTKPKGGQTVWQNLTAVEPGGRAGDAGAAAGGAPPHGLLPPAGGAAPHTLVKHWSNTGQALVKRWSPHGLIRPAGGAARRHTLVKH